MTQLFGTRATVHTFVVLMISFVLATIPSVVAAQEQGEFADEAQLRTGPLGLSSRVSWQTMYEDNVFRTAANPVEDIVSTFGGMASARGRMRRVGVTANGTADWVHYATLTRERGANVATNLRLDFLLNRFVPYAGASYQNSRQRQNSEIDVRPRITQSILLAGSLVRIGGKSALDFSAKHGIEAYDDSASIEGINLGEALDRTTDQLMLSFIQTVTPLTRLIVATEMRRDEFGETSYRSADYIRFSGGFESQGWLRGHARLGVQVVTPHNPAISEVRGIFASVGTNATIRDRLQIGLDAERDVSPSFRPGIAYYQSQKFGTSVSYAIRRSVRLLAVADRQFSDYRTGMSIPNESYPLGVDVHSRYGGGLGFHVGDSIAIDLSGTYSERESIVESRRFDGLSFMAGVSHAF